MHSDRVRVTANPSGRDVGVDVIASGGSLKASFSSVVVAKHNQNFEYVFFTVAW
jgi:hypothetical protein